MCISTVTLELIYGAEKSSNPERNLAAVEDLAARLEVLTYDRNAAAHTEQLRAELARLGTPIGPFDQMIAGHARSQGLIIVTITVVSLSEYLDCGAKTGLSDNDRWPWQGSHGAVMLNPTTLVSAAPCC